jgi:hypothetical protein
MASKKVKESVEDYLLSTIKHSKELSKEMSSLSKALESNEGVVNSDRRIKLYGTRVNLSNGAIRAAVNLAD